MANKPTIAISHLGCEKNRIDSEHMLGLLAQAGYQVDSNEELADYVIVKNFSWYPAKAPIPKAPRKKHPPKITPRGNRLLFEIFV